jgi:hypothetical protein
MGKHYVYSNIGKYTLEVACCFKIHSKFGLTWPRAVVFNLFCSRTPRYNFYSTLYPQSCWYIMQVINIV